jgi:DNA-binding transcriptional regulator PaaX
LFDPAGWAAQSARERERLVRATARLAKPTDRQLADAFVAGTRAVAHVRADPLLPVELGPSAAAGDELRSAYDAYEKAFSIALRAWFRDHAG